MMGHIVCSLGRFRSFTADSNSQQAERGPPRQRMSPHFIRTRETGQEKGAGRPELLKSFGKPEGFTNPRYNLGFMYFDGYLVIDHKNQPLRPFQCIPLTLSSKIEGWRAEAIRRADPRIRNMNLMARMPVKVEPSAHGIPIREPLVKETPWRADKVGSVRMPGQRGHQKGLRLLLGSSAPALQGQQPCTTTGPDDSGEVEISRA